MGTPFFAFKRVLDIAIANKSGALIMLYLGNDAQSLINLSFQAPFIRITLLPDTIGSTLHTLATLSIAGFLCSFIVNIVWFSLD